MNDQIKKPDALEKFITENRAQFDDKDPNPLLWGKIESHLAVPSERVEINWWKYVSVAAVALVLILFGTIVGMQMNSDYSQSQEFVEYEKAEQYFSSQVNQKLKTLANFEYDASVEEDLRQLDEIYEELRQELMHSENPNKQHLIDAMIMNYQTKISILERVLEKMDTHEPLDLNNNENEKTNI
jgi:hypothetical protein